ncbi:hypothetical protein ACN38_g2767 [Penicillium nordicum]|uniref:Uncharacterized protein n=1 Tax=Penicillium nordicum TaxID=229535 RepID=A0A0M9WIM0_9EURO|nr:hypothetical protein ACN38_g2767 [Penicillium nordicum]
MEPEAVLPEADSRLHPRPKPSRQRDKLQLSCNPCRRHRDVIVKTLARTVLLEDKYAHILITRVSLAFQSLSLRLRPQRSTTDWYS